MMLKTITFIKAERARNESEERNSVLYEDDADHIGDSPRRYSRYDNIKFLN